MTRHLYTQSTLLKKPSFSIVASLVGVILFASASLTTVYASSLQGSTSGLQGHRENPPVTGSYDRSRAVSWALLHAQDQPPSDASCTWFVSNALWQGGLAKTSKWTSEGMLGNFVTNAFRDNLPGTLSAWSPRELKSYLLRTYPSSTWKQLDFRKNVVPEAEIGDLIFYDWGEGEGMSHASIIVNIAPGQYPEVSEWSPQGAIPASYSTRGWTYSEIRHDWLQVKYPKVKAYLLHINPTNPARR